VVSTAISAANRVAELRSRPCAARRRAALDCGRP